MSRLTRAKVLYTASPAQPTIVPRDLFLLLLLPHSLFFYGEENETGLSCTLNGDAFLLVAPFLQALSPPLLECLCLRCFAVACGGVFGVVRTRRRTRRMREKRRMKNSSSSSVCSSNASRSMRMRKRKKRNSSSRFIR